MDSLRIRSSIRDLKSIHIWKSLVAELVGTFILVYIGSHSGSFKRNSLKVGMGFGFGGAVAIYCIGNISGGHINPAVSFSLLLARQISLIRFLLYCIAQVVGAAVASHLSSFSELSKNVTKTPKTEETDMQLFLCEIIITFFLVFSVMRLCVEKNRTKQERALAPFMIGLAIMLGVLSGGEIGGGSMNPAASIALSFRDKRLWIFIVAPLIGGAIASLFQQLLFTSELSLKHVKGYLMDSEFGMENETPNDDNKPTSGKSIDKEAETAT